MNVSFNRLDMLALARRLTKVAPETSPVEALTGILIEADADNFEVALTAINMEVSLRFTMAAAVAVSGSAVVNAQLFAGMLSLFGDAPVNMEVLPNRQMILACGKAVYNIMTLPAQNYPKPVLPETTSEVIVSGLNSLVTRTVFAVSKNKESLALQCVKLEVGSEFVRLTGTDTNRLMVFRKKLSEDNKPLTLLVPSASFQLLAGMVEDSEKLTISTTDKQAVFQTNTMTFTARLGHGAYLDVDSVLSSIEKRYEALVDAGELRSALDALDVIAAASDRVQMVFQVGDIALSCEGENGAASSQAKAQVLTPMPKTGFYYPLKSLLQCAKAMGDSLQLRVSETGILLVSNNEQTYMQVPVYPKKKADKTPTTAKPAKKTTKSKRTAKAA